MSLPAPDPPSTGLYADTWIIVTSAQYPAVTRYRVYESSVSEEGPWTQVEEGATTGNTTQSTYEVLGGHYYTSTVMGDGVTLAGWSAYGSVYDT